MKKNHLKLQSPRAIAYTLIIALVIGSLLSMAQYVAAYSTGDIATSAEGLNSTYGGQCRIFVYNVVRSVTGVSTYGYQQGFANAGAVEIADPANATRGDIIQITPAGSTDATAESMYNSSSSSKELHTTIIRSSRNADGSFNVVDSNWGMNGLVTEHKLNPYTWASGSIIKIWRFGTPANQVSGSGFKPSYIASAINANGDIQIFAIGLDGHPYTMQQTSPGSDSWTNWVMFNGYAKSAAMSQNSDGRLQLFYIGTDGAVYYRYQLTPSSGNWSNEFRVNANLMKE